MTAPDRRRGPVVLALAGLLAAGHVAAAPKSSQKELRQADDPRARAEDQADNEAYKQFQFGNQFYQRGLIKEAIGALRRATDVQPIYPDAYYVLALCHLDLNDPASAIGAAQTALQQNPLFTEAHNVLGLAYAKQGRQSEALKEFQLVLADVSFPTPEVAHFNIGRLAWEKQAFEDAVLHFRRALEINPSFGRAWYLMGDCQENMGQLDDAQKSYRRAVELMPREVGPRYRIGVICFKQGDKACARQHFEQVRLDAPGSDMAEGAREYLRQLNFQ